MNPIDSKLKKIIAMIDGATSEGEARATVLQLAPNERHGQGRATLAPAHSSLFLCDCNRSIARI